MRQPIQVAIYPARRQGDDWQYLLLHRRPGNFSIWQGVTGGVEGDEAELTAARREFTEETGLEPLRLEPIGFTYTFPLADRWRDKYGWEVDTITEHVFVAIVDSDSEPVLSPEEHDKSRWCTFQEAFELLYWLENKDCLVRCRDWLNAHHQS